MALLDRGSEETRRVNTKIPGTTRDAIRRFQMRTSKKVFVNEKNFDTRENTGAVIR
jgi:hypothetical protein